MGALLQNTADITKAADAVVELAKEGITLAIEVTNSMVNWPLTGELISSTELYNSGIYHVVLLGGFAFFVLKNLKALQGSWKSFMNDTNVAPSLASTNVKSGLHHALNMFIYLLRLALFTPFLILLIIAWSRSPVLDTEGYTVYGVVGTVTPAVPSTLPPSLTPIGATATPPPPTSTPRPTATAPTPTPVPTQTPTPHHPHPAPTATICFVPHNHSYLSLSRSFSKN